jgi:membrane protein YdbS with pleckstrin-like domain
MTNPKISIILRLLIWAIAAVIALTIGFAWWQYPEPYNFFQDTVSSLGGNLSISGYDNATSAVILTIGFSLCSIIALSISLLYFFNKQLFWHTGKAIIALLMMIGGIGIAIPRDHPQFSILHGLGAMLFIATFGIFNGVLQLLRYSHKHRSKPKNPAEKKTFDFYLDLSLVYLTLLSSLFYLVIHILAASFHVEVQWMSTAFAQKIVVIIACVAVFVLDLDDI